MNTDEIMVVAVLLLCPLLIVIGISLYLRHKKQKRDYEENKIAISNKSLLQSLSSIPNLIISRYCIAPDSSFAVGFDDENKFFIYLQQSDYEIYKYEDIISVQLIEDSKMIFEKSQRAKVLTIVGGLVGNAAGTVAAATMSNTYQNKLHDKLIVKLLLRNSYKASLELVCFNSRTMTDVHRPVHESYPLYRKAKAFSENVIDCITVIIDSINQKEKGRNNNIIISNSVSDEIAKLADLKDRGALSEEEFNQQKAHLLSSTIPSSSFEKGLTPK